MSLYGRNEPCPCGSGKKYKKCCIGQEDKIFASLPEKFTIDDLKQQDLYFQPVHPSHDSSQGIRDFTLAQLEQLIIYLNQKYIRDDMIQTICEDLIRTVDEGESFYYEEMYHIYLMKGLSLREVENQIKILKTQSKIKYGLTSPEKTLVRQIAHSLMMEYFTLGESDTCDYGAMKVFAECCYHIVKQGISEKNSIWMIELYVDTGNRLINWEIHYDSNPSSKKGLIHFEWKTLDELENEFEKSIHKLRGLREESIKALSTAGVQEKAIPKKSAEKISYAGLAMNYFGILECELRDLIIIEHPHAPKRMMWREICSFIKNNYLSIIVQMPELVEQLIELHPIRNKAAHGEVVTLDEFEKVKYTAVGSQLLTFISWAKLDHEESGISH